ncbi:hypothetical protein [Polymorphospora rubra]|uniref:Uncharacterized protein n=1 Tax=Polymorphospora rubra TaxID=338584 RepID=A0A810N8I5_9ACTN|nr:hypothetical protein [Polymorphospora rubra]BCJ69567.1 hypothetical protein Prubr_65880 [Polymorphospora rubra]
MKQLSPPLLWLRNGPEEVQSLVAGLDLVRTAAHEDASHAWLCMIANGTAHYLSTYAPTELLSRLYATDNELYGVVAPVGRLRAGMDGGLVLDGCWRFGSGSQRAAVMAMGCEPVAGRRVTVLVDRLRLEVAHPWEGPGLLATASHTLRASGVRVSPADVVDMTDVPTGRPVGIYADPDLFLANMPGVALGLAERLLALLGPGPVPGVWQATYAEAVARNTLARRGLVGMLHSLDTLARAGRLTLFSPALRQEFLLMLSAAYHIGLDAAVALAEGCDSTDPGIRQELEQARVDIATMRPHGAMRPSRLVNAGSPAPAGRLQ